MSKLLMRSAGLASDGFLNALWRVVSDRLDTKSNCKFEFLFKAPTFERPWLKFEAPLFLALATIFGFRTFGEGVKMDGLGLYMPSPKDFAL